jgi:hypothetical protein
MCPVCRGTALVHPSRSAMLRWSSLRSAGRGDAFDPALHSLDDAAAIALPRPADRQEKKARRFGQASTLYGLGFSGGELPVASGPEPPR